MTTTVMGVDGGTTKTIALVADQSGQILGIARGTGSNATGDDIDEPMKVVSDTAIEALNGAGIASRSADLGMFTLAGADWQEDLELRHRILGKAGLADEIIVKNDTFGGLRAGTRCPYGVVVAAGTGANTAIITPSGQEWAFGYYQNYGGALDFSREAIEAVLKTEAGRGAPTILTDLVLKQLNFQTVEDMLKALINKRVELAHQLALCPRVFEASTNGDEIASEIIVQHGLALADYAVAAIRRFNMLQETFDVVLAGSIFKGPGKLLQETITMAIHRFAPHSQIVRSHFEPAVGALLLAYDKLGIPVSEAMYERLTITCPPADFFNTGDGSDQTGIN